MSSEPGAADRTGTNPPDASLPPSREPGARKHKDVAPQEERRRVLAALLSSKKHIMLPDWLILTQRGRRLKVDSVLCACEPRETSVSYKPPTGKTTSNSPEMRSLVYRWKRRNGFLLSGDSGVTLE